MTARGIARWVVAGFGVLMLVVITVAALSGAFSTAAFGADEAAAPAARYKYDAVLTIVTVPHGTSRAATTAAFDSSAGAQLVRPSLRTVLRLSTPAISRVRATKGVPCSALEDASQSAFKAAEGPISISRKHFPGAGGRYNKFDGGVDIDGVVREALKFPNALFRPNPGGGYRVDTDLDRAGRPKDSSDRCFRGRPGYHRIPLRTEAP